MIDWTQPLETFGSQPVDLVEVRKRGARNVLTHKIQVRGYSRPWFCDEDGCWNPGQAVIRNVPALLVMMEKPT